MTLLLDRLSPAVRLRAAPFLEDLVRVAGGNLHSLHVVGSAVTPDWLEERSDINTLLVLREMDLLALEAVAPLGRRHRRRRIAAPLVMDTGYIAGSLDVFPMEFLELQQIHVTLAGEDLLAGLTIGRADLRHQCEREVKSRLVGLRQGYLRSLGDATALAEVLTRFLAGYQALARGILVLLGREVPVRRSEIFAALAAVAGGESGVFGDILAVKEGQTRPGVEAVRSLFERCHRATERLGRLLDELAS